MIAEISPQRSIVHQRHLQGRIGDRLGAAAHCAVSRRTAVRPGARSRRVRSDFMAAAVVWTPRSRPTAASSRRQANRRQQSIAAVVAPPRVGPAREPSVTFARGRRCARLHRWPSQQPGGVIKLQRVRTDSGVASHSRSRPTPAPGRCRIMDCRWGWCRPARAADAGSFGPSRRGEAAGPWPEDEFSSVP